MNKNQLYLEFNEQCTKIHKIMRDIETDIGKEHFVSAEIEFSLLHDEIQNLAETSNEIRKLKEQAQNVS